MSEKTIEELIKKANSIAVEIAHQVQHRVDEIEDSVSQHCTLCVMVLSLALAATLKAQYDVVAMTNGTNVEEYRKHAVASFEMAMDMVGIKEEAKH